jgi:hypothetical protein
MQTICPASDGPIRTSDNRIEERIENHFARALAFAPPRRPLEGAHLRARQRGFCVIANHRLLENFGARFEVNEFTLASAGTLALRSSSVYPCGTYTPDRADGFRCIKSRAPHIAERSEACV